MANSFGISRGGRRAEDLFLELTGAKPSPEASKGDALLEGNLVEVKGATANTLNQVRAVKYIPLVVYFIPTDEWYVVPPHVVVAAVSQKSRGQHTENPFESATLNVANLSAYRVAHVDQLREETLKAVAGSSAYPELREAMDEVLKESKELAAESLARVRGLLHRLGLGT